MRARGREPGRGVVDPSGVQAARRGPDRLRPGRGHEHPVGVPDQGPGEPVRLGGVGEPPPALVAVPLLVDLRVVGGEAAHDPPAAVVGPLPAAGRAVLTDAAGGDQVERAGPEPVRRAGERADRADLHGVAGVVGVERVAVGGADHLVRPALDELDERVAGDLLGEPRAPGAGDAAFPVEQHLRGDGDRLFEGPLGLGEPGLPPADGHSLVLQRALTALVAHRAVQRVVHQQQFHDAGLRFLRHPGGELGAYHHALGAHGGTGGHRLALAFHLDQALPASADRVQQGMVAEPGNLDAEQLGRPDHQRSLRHGHLEAVDGNGHGVDGHGRAGRAGPAFLHGHRSIGLRPESALSRSNRTESRRRGRTGSRRASGARYTRPGSTGSTR